MSYCDIMWNMVIHIVGIFRRIGYPVTITEKLDYLHKYYFLKKLIWKRGILKNHINVCMYGTFELTYPDVQLDLDTYVRYISKNEQMVPYGTSIILCSTLSYLDIRLTILWLPYVCDWQWMLEFRWPAEHFDCSNWSIDQVNFGHKNTFFILWLLR